MQMHHVAEMPFNFPPWSMGRLHFPDYLAVRLTLWLILASGLQAKGDISGLKHFQVEKQVRVLRGPSPSWSSWDGATTTHQSLILWRHHDWEISLWMLNNWDLRVNFLLWLYSVNNIQQEATVKTGNLARELGLYQVDDSDTREPLRRH